MSNKHEIEIVIWNIICSLIAEVSPKQPKKEEVQPEDLITTYFFVSSIEEAKKPECENANLWGVILWKSLERANELYGKNIKFDFSPREEWDLFKTVGDFWMYLVAILKGWDRYFK